MNGTPAPAGEETARQRVSGPLRFLLCMVFVYALVGVVRPELALTALHGFRAMLGRVLPILGLVFVALLAVNMLGPERIKKRLGRESGWRGWLFAALAGIFISGPPYMLYPMLGELRRQGIRDAFLGIILYNRNVKIPFVPVMVYYFGVPYTVILSTYILLFAFLNGLLLEVLVARLGFTPSPGR